MTAALQKDLQSIARDLDASLLEFCAFRRARNQDRVCVVNVRVNLPASGRLAQEIKTAVADRQMIQLASTARSRPHDCKFVVTPESAIEQNHVGVGRRL